MLLSARVLTSFFLVIAFQPVKETILIVWFQAIVVPSPRITIEPAFCSLVLDLDKREDTFFDVKLERGVELGRDLFVERRLEILSGEPVFYPSARTGRAG